MITFLSDKTIHTMKLMVGYLAAFYACLIAGSGIRLAIGKHPPPLCCT